MKLIPIVLICLLLLIPLSNAGLSDVGEGIIANGMERFFVNVGDSCFEMSMQLEGLSEGGNSTVSTAIFHMATFSFNPFESPIVIDKQKDCSIIFLFVGVILIFVYGAQAIIAHYRPQAAQSMNYIAGQSNSTPIPEFITKIGSMFGVLLFVDFFILMALAINYVLCSMIMINVINHITVAPDNVLFYCVFGMLYFCMNMFYLYRTMVICVVAAYGLLIGLMYLINATKWVASAIIGYFIVMTYMQFIIAAICAIIIPMIESGYELLPGGAIIEYGPGGFLYIISYFILLIIIFAVGVVCVFSPIILLVVSFLFRKALRGLF